MADQSFDYGFQPLLARFKAWSWSERWHNVSAVIRGFLRSRQVDSRHRVLMGSGIGINKRHGRITTGGVCFLGSGCRLAVIGKQDQPAHLHIGAGTHIGDRTIINVVERMEIGDRCLIASDCDLSDTDFHQIVLADGQRPLMTCPVIIEDDVWVGARSLILKGVTIGHHSVIGAGSVVRKEVPPYSLMAGNPARRVAEIASWDP